MKNCSPLLVLVLLFGAVAVESPAEVDFRFPVGLTYANGAWDVADRFEENYEEEHPHKEVDVLVWPVGASFHPYAEFDYGFGFGASLGPITLGFGDVDYVDVPVGLDVRYAPAYMEDISPTIRAGFRYHLVDGDYVEGSEIGFFGALGVEFMRQERVGIGVEAGYDSSEVEFQRYPGWETDEDTEKIRPSAFVVSVFAVF